MHVPPDRNKQTRKKVSWGRHQPRCMQFCLLSMVLYTLKKRNKQTKSSFWEPFYEVSAFKKEVF